MTLNTSAEYRDALAKLQVRIRDTLAGYDEILDRAEPGIRPLMERFSAAHAAHEADLSAQLRTHGCVPDEDGSFFSTVQRLVIKTRAVFDDIDEDVLNSVIKGEERIMQLYDEAMAAARDEEDLSLLSRQRGQIARLVQDARHLAD
ncbi:DUF2383 domain-containing protein [Roseovarius atlanticus]|uniref:DUF2383 domain-containing protein n=1 Tax=Roseovarius atlanticus TaxID=1641875 RepID=UPI001C93B4CD|nr:DUF2383 domain-containing protein [Roseovarius atlanticus]MBY5988606.1 PA2169 family four-helix-bundle protein [Roseovarius atlanticus]MBY6123996.1 PA2169 family four-helix-bundle protein [Roseovarius atlanticus]MBY6148491.1 PA2169 family four-helix-bundle protein [Roseovarius atlanticus]